MEPNKIQLAPDELLDDDKFSPLPYYLLGEHIFLLRKWLIEPYLGKCLTKEPKIYDYRLSRDHLVLENAFSILSAIWRLLNRPILANIEQAEQYVLDALVLHNYLRQTSTA